MVPATFRRRGLAIGIAFSGVGVGSVTLFPILQAIIARAGWRAACWTLAGLIVVVLLPLNALVPRRRTGTNVMDIVIGIVN